MMFGIMFIYDSFAVTIQYKTVINKHDAKHHWKHCLKLTNLSWKNSLAYGTIDVKNLTNMKF